MSDNSRLRQYVKELKKLNNSTEERRHTIERTTESELERMLVKTYTRNMILSSTFSIITGAVALGFGSIAYTSKDNFSKGIALGICIPAGIAFLTGSVVSIYWAKSTIASSWNYLTYKYQEKKA